MPQLTRSVTFTASDGWYSTCRSRKSKAIESIECCAASGHARDRGSPGPISAFVVDLYPLDSPVATAGNRRRSDMAFLLKSGGKLLRNRGITLTEFYQQNSRRLRHQFGRRVRVRIRRWSVIRHVQYRHRYMPGHMQPQNHSSLAQLNSSPG